MVSKSTYILVLFVFMLIFLIWVEPNSYFNFKYDKEQKLFSESLNKIASAHVEVNKIFENEKGILDSTKYIEFKKHIFTPYSEIIVNSKLISDKFLDSLGGKIRVKYRDLINNYELMLTNSEGQSFKNNDLEVLRLVIFKNEEYIVEYNSKHQKSNIEKVFKDLLKKYNIPLIQDQKANKSFGNMLLHLLIGGIIAMITYRLMVGITMVILMNILGRRNKFTFRVIISCVITIIIQAYFWILWTSFCVFSVRYYIDSPRVSHPWLYYDLGLFAATFIFLNISGLDDPDSMSSLPWMEQRIILFVYHPRFYYILTILVFLIFSFLPGLMQNNYLFLTNQ
jgi:hypothetical protein